MSASAPTLPLRRRGPHFAAAEAARPALVLLGLLLVLWPTARWFFARMTDGSDEPYGILALVAALAFIPWRRASGPLGTGEALTLAGLVAMYALLPAAMPPLVAGIVAMAALTVLARSAGAPPAVAGLLLLALPVVASMQFFLGYPLRVFTAATSAGLLNLLGYAAERQGTMLGWAGETVAVDAPCSGVRMLWSASLLAAVLAGWFRLGWGRCFAAAALTIVIALLGNTLRATGLFFIELGLVPAAKFMHEGWGLVCFALVCAGIAGTTMLLARRISPWEPGKQGSPASRRLLATLWAVLALAAVITLAKEAQAAPSHTTGPPPVWPQRFEGRALSPIALSADDQAWAATFPGHQALFTDGHRRILFRQILQPTRRLHPPEDCLRGQGYAVSPLPLLQDSGGPWRCVAAERDGAALEVRSQIRDAHGTVFTDVSSWYWACLLGRTEGPWTATTIWTPTDK